MHSRRGGGFVTGERAVEFSDEFGGAPVFSCVSLGADTIVGGGGSDGLIEHAALLGMAGADGRGCCDGTDQILGGAHEILGFAYHEIVTGGVGDEVLFGEAAADLLVRAPGAWAGGAGEDLLVGAQDAAMVTCFVLGDWTDGGTSGTFAAMLEDLRDGGRMIWAGTGTDTLDLDSAAA